MKRERLLRLTKNTRGEISREPSEAADFAGIAGHIANGTRGLLQAEIAKSPHPVVMSLHLGRAKSLLVAGVKALIGFEHHARPPVLRGCRPDIGRVLAARFRQSELATFSK